MSGAIHPDAFPQPTAERARPAFGAATAGRVVTHVAGTDAPEPSFTKGLLNGLAISAAAWGGLIYGIVRLVG